MHIYIYIYIYIVEIHEKYREFEIKLYYKRDVFCFCIVWMQYQDCNILTKFFNAVVGSEILILTSTTSSKENSQKLIITFLIRMHR